MPSLPRRFVAEMIGTFALVFFGSASVIASGYPGTGVGLLGVAIAHAIALSVAVTATMHISGGHLNPAVTIGLLAVRRIDIRTAVTYIGAQLAAAALSAVALKAFFPAAVARVTNYGLPQLSLNATLWQGIGLEAVMAFFLMSAIFGTIVALNAPKIGGFGVGLTLLFTILGGGPITGAALNPARSFAPALASGEWMGHGIYWIGPIIGTVVAAFVWEFLLKGEKAVVR